MDYDTNDALLHWIFRHTQGDAWFKPDEESISSGVALRVSHANDTPEFRVFPYENETLEPFETAVCALNPLVAVKVRSAAVHAALAQIEPDAKSIYVDANTRIQIIHSMLHLPQADREQCAAFIRDERVMVIWSESLERIVPTCNDFDERLIKLLWRSRHHLTGTSSPTPASSSVTPSVDGHTPSFSVEGKPLSRVGSTQAISLRHAGVHSRVYGMGIDDDEKGKEKEKVDETVEGTIEHHPGPKVKKLKRTWYGKKYEQEIDLESQHTKRPTKLFAPFYNGVAAAMSLVFIGNGIRTLLREFTLDGSFTRFSLIIIAPLLFCVSLFFCMQILQNLSMILGPIAHYHTNSTYYSALKPPPPSGPGSENLPHITIQMPVYKESLEKVLKPSIESLKKCMQTYARQGGTCGLFVCDDGMRLISAKERDERIVYYANHNIGWVARPEHDSIPGGYKRAGRFKKASNMNFGLALSLKAEKHLERLLSEKSTTSTNANGTGTTTPSSGPGTTEHGEKRTSTESNSGKTGGGSSSTSHGHGTPPQAKATSGSLKSKNKHGLQYQNRDGGDSVIWGVSPGSPPPPPSMPGAGNGSRPGTATGTNTTTGQGTPPTLDESDLEERALALAIEETYLESQPPPSPSTTPPKVPRPWAANGRSLRIGEFILLVDSDTIVPEDCLRDAVREFNEPTTHGSGGGGGGNAGGEKVGIIQHESDVMQVIGHWFENGVAYFTRRVNKCISISCANGEVAPFVGHNAFLRWKAMQDAAFVDPLDGKEKIWSESNVSEDFDMALRMLQRGYIIRWATYSKGGFKEGVSLSVDDELNRWQKYAFGCNELLFNPLVQWWRRGPISSQIHKFMWSKAPLHYKISMLSYMFSYYGIAASITISLINYIVLGFQFPVDGWFMHSFEIWLATCVVFWGSGTIGYTLLEYRLGEKKLTHALIENILWIPFFFFFFGGLSIPLSQAIFAHLFSYNIQWTATIKEVERSNFFKEIPKIWKRFWFSILVSWVLIGGVVGCAVIIPVGVVGWRVGGEEGWAVILPLVMSAACHILFPIVLNPWLMVFSY